MANWFVFDKWVGLATVLVLLSFGLTFVAITKHLLNYTKPYLQRYIVRILLMVPIYSLNAWLALILPATGIYLDSFREIYESFVIYSFMKYLLNFLQYDTNLQQYIEYKPGPRNLFPLCCLPSCVGGKMLLLRCKHGILQYVVIRPITSLIAFITQMLDSYGEGNYNPLSGKAFPILLIVNNASQLLAMYCLVIFYTGYQQELRPMKPLGKFFSIKLVVFFSFFQSVLISALLLAEPIEEFFESLFPELAIDKESHVLIARKLQELLICFDMLIASIAHQFTFPHWPFVEENDYFSNLIGDEANQNPSTSINEDPFATNINNNSNYITHGYTSANEDGDMDTATRTRGLDAAGLAATSFDNSLIGSCNSYSTTHSRPQTSYGQALYNLLDFTDERSDMVEHFVQIFGRFRGLFRFNSGRLPVVEIITRPDVASSSSSTIQIVDNKKLDDATTNQHVHDAVIAEAGANRRNSATYGSTETCVAVKQIPASDSPGILAVYIADANNETSGNS